MSESGLARSHRRGLRVQIMVVISLAATLVAFVLVLVLASQMRTLLAEESEKRAILFGQELSDNVAFATFSNDAKGLQATVSEDVNKVADMVYAVVRGSDGAVLTHAINKKFMEASVSLADLPPSLQTEEIAVGAQVELGGKSVLSVTAPILFGKASGEAAIDPMMGMGVEENEAPSDTENAAKKHQRIGTLQIGFDVSGVRTRIWEATRHAGIIGLLVLVICIIGSFFIARMMTVPLERLTRAAFGIAEGDLRQSLAIDRKDEIGDLARSFSAMTDRLRQMLGELRTLAGNIETQAGGILGTSAQQSAMATQQVTAINETSTTVSEIAQTSKQATEQADLVIKVAQRSEELSQDGQKVVEESVQGLEKLAGQVKAIAHTITDLSERTRQIGDIIASVKEFAEQSNLLALNASIEAAKAGENGRGFSVVAMEMHNLAEQSKVAAGQVRSILGEIQKGTRAAVAAGEEGSKLAREAMGAAQRAGSSISGLAEVIRDSSLAARQIANNTRQQTTGVEQIVAAISELSSGVSDAVEGTKKIETVATSLTSVSKRLSELVSKYQT